MFCPVRIKALSILAGACGISRLAARIARSSSAHKTMNPKNLLSPIGRLFLLLFLLGLFAFFFWHQHSTVQESARARMQMQLEFAG